MCRLGKLRWRFCLQPEQSISHSQQLRHAESRPQGVKQQHKCAGAPGAAVLPSAACARRPNLPWMLRHTGVACSAGWHQLQAPIDKRTRTRHPLAPLPAAPAAPPNPPAL